LMAAFRIVHDREPTARLLLLSSTITRAHRAKYETMARELGFASRFTIASSTLDELPDFLAAADVAVVPRPNSPGIPTKLLNYMAAGNAIVSFKQSATILQYKVTAFRKSFRTNVQSFVIGRFDWPSIAVRL